jgi:hypothetical protein
MTCLAWSIGMAKPTPMLPDDCPLTLALAVVMPTTWPAPLISGPPELPGLMAASVWMASSSVSLARLSPRR